MTGYYADGDFCEMFGNAGSNASHTADIRQRLASVDIATLRARTKDAQRELYNLGITFTVYTERHVIDRVLPFDVIPRVLSQNDWRQIDSGVKQRVAALNLFLSDIYGRQSVLKDSVVPADLVLENDQYQPLMHDVAPRHGSFVNICGTDIVRDEGGKFLVLEDNARTPSGVSYVIENRQMMLRAFPDLLADTRIHRVGDYGVRLAEALAEMAPESVLDPQVVVMSPGVHPRVLSGVLRTPADVREGQRRQQIGEGPLAVNHTKAFFDDPLQVDTSPANHAVHLWIGAGFHDRREFAHLFLRQEPGTARTGTVFQAIWPFVIEAMRPISQCLAIHTADFRRFRAAHAVVCRRQGQKPANLARIATAPSQVPKRKAVIIIPKGNAC